MTIVTLCSTNTKIPGHCHRCCPDRKLPLLIGSLRKNSIGKYLGSRVISSSALLKYVFRVKKIATICVRFGNFQNRFSWVNSLSVCAKLKSRYLLIDLNWFLHKSYSCILKKTESENFQSDFILCKNFIWRKIWTSLNIFKTSKVFNDVKLGLVFCRPKPKMIDVWQFAIFPKEREKKKL